MTCATHWGEVTALPSDGSALVAVLVAILHPLPHVAVHVEEAERVGIELTKFAFYYPAQGKREDLLHHGGRRLDHDSTQLRGVAETERSERPGVELHAAWPREGGGEIPLGGDEPRPPVRLHQERNQQ